MKPVSFKPISFTRAEIETIIANVLNSGRSALENDKDSLVNYVRSGFAAQFQSELIKLELNKFKGVK